MKKIILLHLALFNLAFAYNYDEVLLKAQASIFPKIMLLDKKLEYKLIDGKIVYTIIYDKSDYFTALDINNFINTKYKGYLDKYAYRINLVEISDFSQRTEASSIYVLHVGKYIKKIATIAKEKGVISFSYDINNLKNGLMFSLSIEKSIVLYLEKRNIPSQDVDFVDSLLQMVRFIDSKTFNEKIIFNDVLTPKLIYVNIVKKLSFSRSI
ncbi:MAG: hypothetical protein ACI9TV_000287 [Sulfurimonas sp.]|jgi:hypothetical protein|uniref:hypothetical protein n=1 Tax=Sulfurimonas sp. TaxID=2022749 RepID=UPI0039E29427